MTTDEQYFRGLMQDLFNAVVEQAAEDYRDYSVKLLRNPADVEAENEKEEVIAFFLSRYFNIYTTARGKNILAGLEAEEKKMAELFSEFREKKAAMTACWRKRFCWPGGSERYRLSRREPGKTFSFSKRGRKRP